DLGERALESAVLEHDARVPDERLEQAAVIGLERLELARALADDEQPEGAVLAAKRGDDPVAEPALGQVAVEHVRPAGGRKEDGALTRLEQLEGALVGARERLGMVGGRAVPAEHGAQASLGPRREEEDLRILGAHE